MICAPGLGDRTRQSFADPLPDPAPSFSGRSLKVRRPGPMTGAGGRPMYDPTAIVGN